MGFSQPLPLSCKGIASVVFPFPEGVCVCVCARVCVCGCVGVCIKERMTGRSKNCNDGDRV